MKTTGLTLRCILTAVLLGCWSQAATNPPELKLQAQLVWGTNGAKPDDPKLKEVDSEVTEKLRAVFRWKNYFEVNRQTFSVPASSSKTARMSEQCEIEVHNPGDGAIEVKLHGQGKMVVKKTQKIKAGELLVFAGDDKNDTAWFVVLKELEK